MRIIMLMFDTKRKESDGRISNINQKQGMHTRQWPHVYTPLLLPNNIESWWYYVVAPKSNRHFHMVLINMNFFWNLKKVVNQGPSVWLLCEIIHFQFGIFVILWRHLFLHFGTILYQCVTDKSSHTPSKTHQSFIVNKSGVGKVFYHDDGTD